VEDLAYVQTHALEESHWWFVGMREVYRKQIEGLTASRDLSILDVGCGTGGNLALLERFGRTYGLDYSPAAAAFTRGRGWPRVAVASAIDLPHPDGTFDLVTAFGVIEHVEDDGRMLEEMRRVTRPGGHLLIMTSAHPWLWSVHDDHVHHLRRYRRAELAARVTEAGWQLEQLSYVNSVLFPPIAAVRGLQRLLPAARSDADRGMSGFGLPPAPVNRALAGLLSLEGTLMQRFDLPMGVGFICRARKAPELPRGSAGGGGAGVVEPGS
jgi:SAM-dependent methyltransferase